MLIFYFYGFLLVLKVKTLTLKEMVIKGFTELLSIIISVGILL